jgi:hypothetical protein
MARLYCCDGHAIMKLPAENSLFRLGRSPLELHARATAKQITTKPMKRALLQLSLQFSSKLRPDVSASGIIDAETP